jgi:hypothetical protein
MMKAMIQDPSDCGAMIGKQITIHGKFSLLGKFGPYIVQDNQQVVYLVRCIQAGVLAERGGFEPPIEVLAPITV